MNQTQIEVELTVLSDNDVMIFNIQQEDQLKQYSVSLNSPTSQSELKQVFMALLRILEKSEVVLNLTIAEGYTKGLYKDVCTEYIKDLNSELKTTYEKMQNELNG